MVGISFYSCLSCLDENVYSRDIEKIQVEKKEKQSNPSSPAQASLSTFDNSIPVWGRRRRACLFPPPSTMRSRVKKNPPPSPPPPIQSTTLSLPTRADGNRRVEKGKKKAFRIKKGNSPSMLKSVQETRKSGTYRIVCYARVKYNILLLA